MLEVTQVNIFMHKEMKKAERLLTSNLFLKHVVLRPALLSLSL